MSYQTPQILDKEIKMKICTKCKQEKPESEYNARKGVKGGYHRQCKKCIGDMEKENRKLHKDTIIESTLMKKYGITTDDYNRMFADQNGCCKICGIHQSELDRRLNVDHNHVTNRVRGLLCMPCNLGIGNFNDNIALLEGAIDYLKDSTNL